MEWHLKIIFMSMCKNLQDRTTFHCSVNKKASCDSRKSSYHDDEEVKDTHPA